MITVIKTPNVATTVDVHPDSRQNRPASEAANRRGIISTLPVVHTVHLAFPNLATHGLDHIRLGHAFFLELFSKPLIKGDVHSR